MAAPKKPQDHQAKAAKAEATGVEFTIEHNNIAYTIAADVFNDVEILEMIGDMQDGRPLLVPKIVRTIIGAEQWMAFKDGNRDSAGRVPAECLGELFAAIDSAAGNS